MRFVLWQAGLPLQRSLLASPASRASPLRRACPPAIQGRARTGPLAAPAGARRRKRQGTMVRQCAAGEQGRAPTLASGIHLFFRLHSQHTCSSSPSVTAPSALLLCCRPCSRLSMGSATSAVLDALVEEGAETEQALLAAR